MNQTNDKCDSFESDPLAWLVAAAARGQIADIDTEKSVMSRDPDATSCVCVFGEANVRQVLSDGDRFRMPMSAAVRDSLPRLLVNLNSAVFSMAGDVHRERRRALGRILGAANRLSLAETARSVARASRPYEDVDLLSWSRTFAGTVAERVVLGAFGDGVSVYTQRYFDLRRLNTSAPSAHVREDLITTGMELDGGLRDRVSEIERDPDNGGIIGQLVGASAEWSQPLTGDELVAHANILLTASGEPVASTLAWVLLGLSQRPALMQRIRQQRDHAPGRVSALMESTVAESLRLAPPNAVMARVTSQSVRVAGRRIAPGTEIALSPFVEHRDAQTFPAPHAFRPLRWKSTRPTAFQYLPFGAGTRACLGRTIALQTVSHAVADLIGDHDVVLPTDTIVDWRMNVTLAPTGSPVVRLTRCRSSAARGRLLGPARTLIGFPIDADSLIRNS